MYVLSHYTAQTFLTSPSAGDVSAGIQYSVSRLLRTMPKDSVMIIPDNTKADTQRNIVYIEAVLNTLLSPMQKQQLFNGNPILIAHLFPIFYEVLLTEYGNVPPQSTGLKFFVPANILVALKLEYTSPSALYTVRLLLEFYTRQSILYQANQSAHQRERK